MVSPIAAFHYADVDKFTTIDEMWRRKTKPTGLGEKRPVKFTLASPSPLYPLCQSYGIASPLQDGSLTLQRTISSCFRAFPRCPATRIQQVTHPHPLYCSANDSEPQSTPSTMSELLMHMQPSEWV